VARKKYNSANDEIQRLTSQNNTLQQQVNDLTSSNKSMSAEYSSYKTDCEASQRKLEAYQTAIQEEFNKQAQMEHLLDSAVQDFAGHGVMVYAKDGRVFVNMEDQLMYKSGSSKVNEEGKQALAAIASALNSYPDLQVIVVGHTDDTPFKGSNKDNLSLSTERANSVVRILRDEYSVNPDRLVAAGQGVYAPVADNTTPEGKAKNRRTEIILNPNYQKIWSTVENKQ